MATNDVPASARPATRYDAFVSYSHADRRWVGRIQRFVESYRPPGRGRRLALFVDHTDLRGGSLPDNLRAALAASGALIVCWSPQAAASAWVRQEVAVFRDLGRGSRIAIVHVAGTGPTVRDESFAGLDPIEHDLRGGLRLGWFSSRARIELLRIIAFLCDAELRQLHDWSRRRTARNAAAVAAAGLLPAIGLLAWPVRDWTPLPITDDEGQVVQALACDAREAGLWALAWSQQVGETSGANAYFITTESAGVEPLRRMRASGFDLPRRLLPKDLIAEPVRRDIDRVLDQAGIGRGLAGVKDGEQPRLALPRPDHLVVVLPKRRPEPTLDERIAQARDRLAIPETDGSLVATYVKGGAGRSVGVGSLSPPRWASRTGDRKVSPARGLSVAWQATDTIWLGVPGERDIVGGLWHSPDGGASWQKVEGFHSVTSIELRSVKGRETPIVAEQGFPYVHETQRLRSRSRVVERDAAGRWVDSEAPPHGGESEIELCGTMADGSRFIRVDGTIFGAGTLPLWRSLIGKSVASGGEPR